MYSFLRRPAWILSHLLIALLVAVLIGLGFWQRDRWFEERERQQAIELTGEREPVAYGTAVDPALAPAEVDPEVRFTRVELTGTYDTDAEVAVLNRSQAGRPGAWILTPLVMDDGTAAPVVRGWIPYDPFADTPPFPEAAPPPGEVTVVGSLQPTQERGSFGATDATDGELDALSRVDVGRFAQQLPYDLGPAWVLVEQQAPPQPGDLPQSVSLAGEDPSQNFSYMMQWWIFAAIAAGGYPLVLRGVARHRLRDREDDPDAGDTGGSGPRVPGSSPSEERPVASEV